MTTPLRLQTHVWNPVGDRRALLIHGLTSDGATWWHLASQLSEQGWMVVAPDLRSHGRSPSAIDHRVATMAADVALLGEGWDLIVGHSLGGSIAAVLAGQQHVPATLLIDPVLDLPAANREPLREACKESLANADPASIQAANPRWSDREVQRKALAAATVTPDVVDAVFDHNDPWDVRWAAARWTGAVHLLAADPALDATLHAHTIEEVVRAAGDRVTARVVEGSGHSVHRDEPTAVTEAIAHLTGSP